MEPSWWDPEVPHVFKCKAPGRDTPNNEHSLPELNTNTVMFEDHTSGLGDSAHTDTHGVL